ncbi:MAG: protein-disulfide reductase DsbD N-terminal domain-containing protein [Chitinophagales bacterium]|nr:protein-disulfide reductase DsbD N-terminal domain-containing protein [Chitinophagales bacterium]
MKKLFTIAAVLLIAGQGWSQIPDPVSWKFTSKKTGDKTYEVRLTATIQPGWHLYSQVQPEDAIAIPTGIKFNANPLIVLDKKVKEIGKMEKFHDEKLQLSANQYSGKVDFVQVVKLKASAKTNLSGSVEYQTCDDKKCLPPKTVNFSVAVH